MGLAQAAVVRRNIGLQEGHFERLGEVNQGGGALDRRLNEYRQRIVCGGSIRENCGRIRTCPELLPVSSICPFAADAVSPNRLPRLAKPAYVLPKGPD